MSGHLKLKRGLLAFHIHTINNQLINDSGIWFWQQQTWFHHGNETRQGGVGSANDPSLKSITPNAREFRCELSATDAVPICSSFQGWTWVPWTCRTACQATRHWFRCPQLQKSRNKYILISQHPPWTKASSFQKYYHVSGHSTYIISYINEILGLKLIAKLSENG